MFDIKIQFEISILGKCDDRKSPPTPLSKEGRIVPP
jgi:hypothetical protein